MIAKYAAVEREIFRIVRSDKDPAQIEKAVRQAFREQAASLTDEQRRALGSPTPWSTRKSKWCFHPGLATFSPTIRTRHSAW